MTNPIVSVRHINPEHVYFAQINPPKFWQAVHNKMNNLDLSISDPEQLKAAMVRLASGPSFTLGEIRGGIATDMSGKPVDNNLDPTDFSQFVVQGMLHSPVTSERNHFFSKEVLQDAGIVPAAIVL